jgi:hypothetical protein
MKILIMCLSLIAILNCDISSSDIFILEQEQILGIWHGEVEVPAVNNPGYYSKRNVTITIKDRDTTKYSLQDTFNIWIQEEMTPSTMIVTHQGYLVDIEEQYEATLQLTFMKEDVGSTTKYPIYFTQTANDSIKVQFSTYEFFVRN